MIISWDWLEQYVKPTESPMVVAEKLMMTGLNLEGMEEVGYDLAVDLEVTSNRMDCLGHIGVAREASVSFGLDLTIPKARPAEGSSPVSDATSVEIECEDICPRYVARVIQGVKVGPSPKWMVDRLATVGVASINNLVDISNYVMLECGQPLHAFDFDKLAENRIVVRRAKKGEKIQAIDHKEYELTPDMCIIADAQNPVAIAGVMGGAATEISAATTNVLIEVAEFEQLAVRNTARALKLFSDSSHRFERGVDPHGLDWASRRCCELILEIAGGELLSGSVFAGQPLPEAPAPIELRFAQVNRILGINVPAEEAVAILKSLGFEQQGETTAEAASFVTPSWRRRDVTREADLIEEVARIYGYEKIPEDVLVPLSLSRRTLRDRVVERVTGTLSGAGFYEAITLSLVDPKQEELFTPRPLETPLDIVHSDFRKMCRLRASLVPSLLASRRENERHGTFNAQLYEIASVYLSPEPTDPAAQPKMLSLVSGCSFAEMKGVLEAVARSVDPAAGITVAPSSVPQFVEGRGADISVNGEFWGWFGELDRSVTDKLDLRDACLVAEVDLRVLDQIANLQPQFAELPKFPGMTRDLNFMLDESVKWDDVEAAVTNAAGPLLESVNFSSQYRGKQLPPDKKSYVLTIQYRSPDRTLTGEEVDSAQQAVIAACESQVGAQLR
ncbi:MAG: phenylalanine--tRNA ligase subunit beta [Planctomycetota bacterium]|nr:phenylalanine--tRNA ligase subunit beta [Planctomycetota bacterium]MDA1251754.1 phenylalanine--tRNA ligase subunit beta [Planctomycetota bacterium]